MITYNQLISHAKPFFLSRGGDVLADKERMLFYANTSIQDIYNSDNATFTYKNETITGAINGDMMKFETNFNIRKVQFARGITSTGSKVDLTPTLYFQDCSNEIKFVTGSNDLITSQDYITIEIIYIKEYKWVTMEELGESIQIPDRYIPAAIKFMYDWAAPINLMAGESLNTDFFSHGMTRVNQLKDDDALTDFQTLNPQY